MKKFLLIIASAMLLATSCREDYDDSALWEQMNDFEMRLIELERKCRELNNNISSLQQLVYALQAGDWITSVTPIVEDGKEVGYAISFAKGDTIMIYHGKSGSAPVVGVEKDVDGLYYWTIDGEWFTDADGNKISAQGRDGANGEDGEDGKDGQDGTTPQLKIEGGYWYVSTDNGVTWTELGKATGEDGEDGDSIFTSVDYSSDPDNVIFTLSDGTVITIPRASKEEDPEQPDPSDPIVFEDAAVKSICVANWDTDGDGELSYDEAAAVTSDSAIMKLRNNNDIVKFNEFQYFTGLPSTTLLPGLNCLNLLEITLPDHLTRIHSAAFQCCEVMKTLIIPDKVELIGDMCFWRCFELSTITLPESLIEIQRDAFIVCYKLDNVILPSKLQNIGPGAFTSCESLSSIAIPDSVISMGAKVSSGEEGEVFENCISLKEVTLGKGITTLETGTFIDCTSLPTITIPANIAVIKDRVFTGCSSLATIYIESATPPTLGVDAIPATTNIYVPTASVDAYKAAEGWSKYADKIVGYDFE